MAKLETTPRRPAVWTVLCFGAGFLPAHYLSLPVLPLIGSALLLWLAAILSSRLRSTMLPVLLLLLGALRYQIATQLFPGHHILRAEIFGQETTIEGRIADEPERAAAHTRFVLALEAVTFEGLQRRLSGQVLVTIHQLETIVDQGNRLVLRGRLRQPQPARNPGGFDYRTFLAQQGVHATLAVRRNEQLVETTPQPASWLYEYLVLPVRRSIRQTIGRNLKGAPAGLLQGMLLGEKHRIPEELRDKFRTAGLAHALVISGLHVGLIAVFFFTAFKLCRCPERFACGATVIVLALYALITELQPPVVRAAVMGGVVLVGRLLERRGEIYNSLGLAALLLLIAQPMSLLSLSFQLSFGATLAIVGLHRPLTSFFPKAWRDEQRWSGKWVIAPLCVSLAAQLGVGPLIAYHFQHYALIAPLANLAVVPLLALVVALGLLAALSGWCLPLAATAFNACNFLTIKALIVLVDWFAAIPGASLPTPRIGVGFLLWTALLIGLAAQAPEKLWARKTALFVLLVGLTIGVWSNRFQPHELEVVFLDVGQGDAIFLRFPNGRTMLVDGGERSEYFDYGKRVLLPFMRYAGVERLDIAVASHPHNDHIGGLITVLEEVEVGYYLDSGQQSNTWAARRVRELIREKNIAYHRLAAGDSLIGLGDAGILVLHPTVEFVTQAGESPYNLNNGSLVLRVTFAQLGLLLTGDIEEQAEPALQRWKDRLQTQVLKVPHHGSSTSSTLRFMESVNPEIAIVSVGEGNRHRHPAATIMARYVEQGTEVLRTDQRGAVMLRTDGKKLKLRTMIAPAPKKDPDSVQIR